MIKFAKERVNLICNQLKGWSIVQKVHLDSMRVKEGCFITPTEADAAPGEWKNFDMGKDHWYGPDRHYWFRTEVTVPESFDGKELWLRIHTGLNDWDDGRNPQFLLFINGQVIQGLDINHREVFVKANAKAGETFRMDLQSYTGTLHDEFHLIVDLEEHDRKLRKAYYDIAVPMYGLNRMKEDDKIRLDLETALTDTINLLDLRMPYSKEFYASVEAAEAHVQEAIYEKMGGYDEVIATCIGHTHIDVAWLWTIDQVRQKSCRSFATVLKLMEEYPDYHFMSSQPKLYSFVKERHPEMYQRIKDRVKEGRWEPEGGMWVEADCNLTSGESLVRQFQFGKRFFKEEFDVENKILWLPDVFGYSAALPQIMKKCGIEYFMTTKLAWNEFDKHPYDSFMWEGIDGSRIFTHLITTLGVGQPETSFFTTYNGMLHPDAIMGGWHRYQNKDINNDILVCFGYGDGGGGPTRDMMEMSGRMDKGIKGIPKVRQAFAGQYFDELWERVKDNKRLPEWVGELYFEYHRGTYTSMARNKRSNRKSEYAMMELELLSVLAELAGKEAPAYPKSELDRMWEMILTNQFHDILPGSSIKEVYEDSHVEYGRAIALLEEVCEAVEAALYEPKEGVYTVFNNSNWARSGEAWIPMSEDEVRTYAGGRVLDAEGEEVKSVWEKDGVRIWTKEIPSFAFASFRVEAGARETEKETIETSSIETPYYQIAWNEAGQLTRIFDKKAGREVFPEGKCANELQVFEDKPRCFDAWELEPTIDLKKEIVEDCTSVKVRQDAIGWQVDFTWKYHKSEIRQTMCLYEENPRIDFKTEVDWQERQKLLKTSFPVDVRAVDARFDIQDGNIRRPITRNTSWEAAKFEVAAHKWVDLWETGYGMAVLNDCKYGHDIKEDTIRLTLLKSAVEPDYTADLGTHSFTYAILPHSCEWYEAGIEQSAFALNNPLTAVKGKAALGQESWLSFDQDNLVVDAWKREENGSRVILRFHEFQGRRGEVTLHTRLAVKQWCECNLMEEPEAFKTGEIRVTLKPYEIKTLMFEI